MVRCAAYGCNTNSADKHELKENRPHVFQFPLKNAVVCNQWVHAVSSKRRVKGKVVPFHPTKHSVLCHRHFEDASFERSPALLKSIGMDVATFKLRLRPDAVPTIFPELEQAKRLLTSPPTNLGPKKNRRQSYGAFEKRKRQETINALLNADEENVQLNADEENVQLQATELSDITAVPISLDFTDPISSRVSRGTQTCEEVIFRPTNHKASQVQPKTRETGMVALVKVKDMQCGPDLPFPDMEQTAHESEEEEEDEEEEDIADPDWLPEDDDDLDDEDLEDLMDVPEDPVKEPKYIVFDSCLMKLLFLIACQICTKTCTLMKRTIIGTCLKLTYTCEMGHVSHWTSQPTTQGTPMGNLLLGGSILFSGSTPTVALNVLRFWNVACFSNRTFYKLQRSFGIPAVDNVWRRTQTAILDECRGKAIRVAGDARCCSPGHTAKFGSYTLMDMETGFVLAVELIQSNEVKNSNAMEMEGLTRAFQTLEASGVFVSEITTDRHIQIRKYLREQKPDVKHWFDVWHLAKNVKKKLTGLCKKKGCEEVADWVRSISNHVYFCAASSDGDGDMVEQKWLSVLNHITNKHEGHGQKFPKCLHDTIDRKWIKTDTRAHKELKLALENKRLVKDLRQLSPHEQTSTLEAQHKVVCQFAPKFLTFSYAGMKQRLNLAALHTCCNAERRQAVTREGKLKFKVAYPKYKPGGHSVKPVKEECSYEYVDALLDEMIRLRERYSSYTAAVTATVNMFHSPPPVSSRAKKVRKEEAIAGHMSRFGATQMSRSAYLNPT